LKFGSGYLEMATNASYRLCFSFPNVQSVGLLIEAFYIQKSFGMRKYDFGAPVSIIAVPLNLLRVKQ